MPRAREKTDCAREDIQGDGRARALEWENTAFRHSTYWLCDLGKAPGPGPPFRKKGRRPSPRELNEKTCRRGLGRAGSQEMLPRGRFVFLPASVVFTAPAVVCPACLGRGALRRIPSPPPPRPAVLTPAGRFCTRVPSREETPPLLRSRLQAPVQSRHLPGVSEELLWSALWAVRESRRHREADPSLPPHTLDAAPASARVVLPAEAGEGNRNGPVTR